MKPICLASVLCALMVAGCKGNGGDGASVAGSGQATAGTPSNPEIAAKGDGDTVTEADVQIPFYPGSIPDPSEGNFKQVGSVFTTIISNRTSTDSADKVFAFYKGKQPTWDSGTNPFFSLRGTTSNGGNVQIAINKDGDHSKILITTTVKSK
jgi:hypothetical protein